MKTPRFSRQAIEEATQITLDKSLWNRPQVQGIMIDGQGSQDLDDAIWIEPTPTGAILSVHIADVSEFIPPGSSLDLETIARIQTRYHSTGNISMLPKRLSENLLSLQEWQQRPTLTVQITLKHECQIQAVELLETWVSSAKKLSYAKADRALLDPTSHFHHFLQNCHTWAERLNHQRRASGTLSGIATSSGYWTDENGNLNLSENTRYNSSPVKVL
jgi:ribonuclease R